MPVIGVVSEYNPFHNGHALHIAESRRVLYPDGCAVVSVMSGNAVQRGDIAIADKFIRAEAALSLGGDDGGCDLIIELPAVYALSSAEGFAYAAVYLLDSCGIVDSLSFGSECGDLDILRQVAEADLSPEYPPALKTALTNGISFPAARQKALGTLVGPDADILSSPNNILGVEYIKSLIRLDSPMLPFTMQRVGAEHDSPFASPDIASASHIRKLLLSGDTRTALSYLPQNSCYIYAKTLAAYRLPTDMRRIDNIIMYRLMCTDIEDFTALCDGDSGLAARMLRLSRQTSSYEEFLARVKTKKYPLSRLRRILMRSLLNIGVTSALPPYLRVLGFNDKGRAILNAMRKSSRLPVITKPAHINRLDDAARKIFLADALMSELLSMALPDGHGYPPGREWLTAPARK